MTPKYHVGQIVGVSSLEIPPSLVIPRTSITRIIIRKRGDIIHYRPAIDAPPVLTILDHDVIGYTVDALEHYMVVPEKCIRPIEDGDYEDPPATAEPITKETSNA